jgi:hypothetical protein
LELIKDYNLEVYYHLGKANVVADALSHKAYCNYLLAVSITREESSFQVPLDMAQYNMTLTPMLRGEIIAAQSNDEGVAHIERRLTEGDPKVNRFLMDDEGALWFKDHLVVPKNHELRKKIFDEAHISKYSIQLGSSNMYHDLKSAILVDSDEAQDCSLHYRMRHVLKGQGRLYETCQIAATSEYSYMEMRRHQHWFHCGSASLCPQV